jgi:hypothetical protein
MMGCSMSTTFRRYFVCRICWTLRRKLSPHAWSRPEDPPWPTCCGENMQMLSDEEAAAGARMSRAERAAWLNEGGKYERRGGKRPWRAVRRRK